MYSRSFLRDFERLRNKIGSTESGQLASEKRHRNQREEQKQRQQEDENQFDCRCVPFVIERIAER